MTDKPNVTAVILAALRKHGPSTARELQDATGISATTIRRYLVPPAVTLRDVEWLPVGRGWVKRYMLTAHFCDCGQPAAYHVPITQLSADGKRRGEHLTLCPVCAGLLTEKEQKLCLRML